MAKRPSKGIVIFSWSLIIVSMIQLFYMPALLNVFAFLPRPLRLLSVGYMVAFNCAAIYTAMSALCLKRWSRRVLVILAVLGICDKAFFAPIRLNAVVRVTADKRLGAAMIADYRSMLSKKNPDALLSDEVLLARIRWDLRQAQKGIEALWIFYLFVLAIFFLQANVRRQFIGEESA